MMDEKQREEITALIAERKEQGAKFAEEVWIPLKATLAQGGDFDFIVGGIVHKCTRYRDREGFHVWRYEAGHAIDICRVWVSATASESFTVDVFVPGDWQDGLDFAIDARRESAEQHAKEAADSQLLEEAARFGIEVPA